MTPELEARIHAYVDRYAVVPEVSPDGKLFPVRDAQGTVLVSLTSYLCEG